MLLVGGKLYATMFWYKVITLHSGLAITILQSASPAHTKPTQKTLMPYYSVLILLFISKQSISYHYTDGGCRGTFIQSLPIIRYFTGRREDQDSWRVDREAERQHGGGRHWGGQQPLHLSSPARVYWLWPGPNIPAVREHRVRQGLHWQADKPLQMFR